MMMMMMMMMMLIITPLFTLGSIYSAAAGGLKQTNALNK